MNRSRVRGSGGGKWVRGGGWVGWLAVRSRGGQLTDLNRRDEVPPPERCVVLVVSKLQ